MALLHLPSLGGPSWLSLHHAARACVQGICDANGADTLSNASDLRLILEFQTIRVAGRMSPVDGARISPHVADHGEFEKRSGCSRQCTARLRLLGYAPLRAVRSRTRSVGTSSGIRTQLGGSVGSARLPLADCSRVTGKPEV